MLGVIKQEKLIATPIVATHRFAQRVVHVVVVADDVIAASHNSCAIGRR
jgi:hypothetical protein